MMLEDVKWILFHVICFNYGACYLVKVARGNFSPALSQSRTWTSQLIHPHINGLNILDRSFKELSLLYSGCQRWLFYRATLLPYCLWQKLYVNIVFLSDHTNLINYLPKTSPDGILSICDHILLGLWARRLPK